FICFAPVALQFLSIICFSLIIAHAKKVAETNTTTSLMELLGKTCLEQEALKNEDQWTEIEELFQNLEA
nr:hypothetical protein [Proteus mirabilis]